MEINITNKNYNDLNDLVIILDKLLVIILDKLVGAIMHERGGADILPVDAEWDPVHFALIIEAREILTRVKRTM
jgi:hypothetical protein